VSENREDEIEITPEMIEAGVYKLRRFDERFHSYERGVRDIFTAMLAARKPED